MHLNKVLIIKIAAIGDLLMATPAIHALKKSFPSVELTLLVGTSIKETISGIPYIDKIIEIDDQVFFKGGFYHKFCLVAGLIRCIRKEKFDATIIFHRDWKYGLIASVCGIKENFGFNNSFFSRLFLTKSVLIKGISHHINHYIEVVKLLGAETDGLEMKFYVDNKTRKNTAKRLLEAGWHGERLIGIAPGGARNVKEVMDTRRWPAERYRELISELVSHGYKVALFGSEGDKWFLKDWEMSQEVVNLIGKTTLEEAASLIEQCAVMVANDSGLMHLASAVGTPVVSIFGPTDPREKYPLNPGSFYFWKGEELECSPCYREGVFPECRTMECMLKISVNEVYTKIIDIMKAGMSKGTYLYR